MGSPAFVNEAVHPKGAEFIVFSRQFVLLFAEQSGCDHMLRIPWKSTVFRSYIIKVIKGIFVVDIEIHATLARPELFHLLSGSVVINPPFSIADSRERIRRTNAIIDTLGS
jgi:hypothetical protein